MSNILSLSIALVVAGTAPTVAFADSKGPPHSHDHAEFSAGQPGDPKKPARFVQILMQEKDGKMIYVPDTVEVRKGEQIRFQLRNVGDQEHEFVLATTAENLKHAEQMKKNPDMEHEDPNAIRVQSKKSTDLVWHFTKSGTFEFGCLIPGHRESGMIGTVVVK